MTSVLNVSQWYQSVFIGYCKEKQEKNGYDQEVTHFYHKLTFLTEKGKVFTKAVHVATLEFYNTRWTRNLQPSTTCVRGELGSKLCGNNSKIWTTH